MVELITSREKLVNYLEGNQLSRGLVPTMGNLHQGHLTLIKESINENDLTVVTIFVNPKQFGPNEDFDKYPRTLEADLDAIRSIDKALDKNVIVFAPEKIEDVYPEGFNSTISVHGFDQILCAKDRPGHFDGVTTVVYILFNLIKARRAYFGLKDFQQTLIIRKMVKDLMIPIEIKLVEIVRDSNGLALSSRNKYLDLRQKEEALTLTKSIKKLKDSLLKSGIKDTVKMKDDILEDERFVYLDILDANNLHPLNDRSKEAVIAGAIMIGTTRLIDNTLVSLNVR